MGRTSLLFLGSLAVLGLAATVPAAAPFQQDPGPDGILCVDAVHYDNKFKAANGDDWTLVGPTDAFTGTAGMQPLPNNNNNSYSAAGYAKNAPRLDFNVNLVKTGTYYVWVLGWGSNGNDDSCNAGIDGLEISTCDNMSGWNAQYRWSNSTSDGPRATFDVSTTGVHVLNIYQREDGFICERVLLTTNANYTPTGHGPAESPRGTPSYAVGPYPPDTATDVPRDAVLSWTPGPYAAKHDVYFGMVLADVTAASRTDSKGVLVSQAQDANTYDPAGVFTFGQMYYWRVDEVNAPPSSTIFKGNVWSFTAETATSRVTAITATASSSDTGSGPENTVNGSGLTNNLHGTTNTNMWLSSATGSQPTWIQYAFDTVYKLQEMRVWNYNVVFESVLGYGCKDVLIEYSLDGTTWTTFKTTQFAQAPSQDNYVYNTTVNFAGATAKYVRLTPQSNWGGVRPVYGLSEVRFYYIPVSPRQPSPASGATGVSVSATLSWRAGREAASHNVYFGTDKQAVTNGTAPVKTLTAHSFDPGPLSFGTTYYWKVVEVNNVATPKTWEGDVWSFATQESFVVDDFESYDQDNHRIYDTWIDGAADGKSGSFVGYNPTAAELAAGAHFAETVIVHGGKQSMPLEYNNVKTPFFSEATRTFDTPQDWAAHGADTLTVWFRGQPVGFVESASGSITMSGAGTDIWNAADQFRFAAKRLNGNGAIIAKVESTTQTGADAWAKVGVMIRDSMDPGARFAAVYATLGNGVRYQARLLNAGTATSDTPPATPTGAPYATPEQMALKTPIWIKIERVGTTFNGYYSADGSKWTPLAWNGTPITINMATNAYIGLAVTGHGTGTTVGVVSNVSFTGGVTGSWDVEAIGVAQPTNDAAPLYVTVQDNAGKSKTVVHPDPATTNTVAWQQWRIALGDVGAGGVKLSTVKKLIIGVGDRAGPKPGGAGTIFIDDIGVGHPATASP